MIQFYKGTIKLFLEDFSDPDLLNLSVTIPVMDDR